MSKKPQLFIPIASSSREGWIRANHADNIEEFEKLSKEIGYALLAWSAVEVSLKFIWVASTKSSKSITVIKAWESLESFRTRLAVVDSAVKASDISDQLLEDWDKLKERCRKKSLRRNLLAHGTAFYDHDEPNVSKKYFISRLIFGKSFDTSTKLHLNELEHLTLAFGALDHDLVEFWNAFRAA